MAIKSKLVLATAMAALALVTGEISIRVDEGRLWMGISVLTAEADQNRRVARRTARRTTKRNS